MHTKLLASRLRKAMAIGTALAISAAVGAPAVLASGSARLVPPRNLALTPSRVTEDGQVALNWDASASRNITAYEVHRIYGASADTARADETTYVGTTADLSATDLLAVEGRYHYAVVAVDKDGNRSAPSTWRSVLYDDSANGDEIATDTTRPEAPTDLVAEPVYTRDGAVTLSWTAPEDEDIARYLVYRSAGDARAQFLGYVEGGLAYFDDLLTEDGVYTYTVVAQDLAGNLSDRAEPATATMDTVAPAVTIRTPDPDKVYRPEGSLTVRIRVAETGSGYDEEDVAYFLDGDALDAPVIPLADLDDGTHKLEVQVTDRAGNVGTATASFKVSSRRLEEAPVMLTESAATDSRTVEFAWEAPLKDVTGYNVYRAQGDGEFELLCTTAASERRLTDVVPGEGVWSYRVTALYGSEESVPSGSVVFTVDETKPSIRISSPEDGAEYLAEGELAVSYSVRDRLAGVDKEDVIVELDGAPLTRYKIDLAKLAEGEHVLEVTAADRAGNQETRAVTFTVVAPPTDGEDDGDPTGDEAFKQEVLAVLAKWQSKIHHGQYNALKAKVMNGNWFSFVKQVQKFSGKFIHPDAAKELLGLFDWWDGDWFKHWGDSRSDDDCKNGDKHWAGGDWDDDDDRDDDDEDDDDDDDDDDRRWSPGKGNKKMNPGLGNGRKK